MVEKQMKKTNLNEILDRLLTKPERLALLLTGLFALLALVIALRPAGEIHLEQGSVRSTPETDALVDLNAADLETLESLPGIGPELARRIIEYREANGGFTAASELTLVDGIGDKTYSALLTLVTAGEWKEETP